MASLLRLSLLLLLCTAAEARDLGVRGHLFPVEEPNLLDMIRDGVRTLPEGEIQRRFVRLFREPRALAGIRTARAYREWLFDPSVHLQRDIVDHEGSIVVAKGTTLNPLTHMTLSQPLFLLDGTRPEQVAWARSQEHGKWILVRGRPLELEESEGRPVYFDQFGYLTRRFGVRAVPARVTQEGNRLHIEEIPVDEEGRCLY